MSICKQCRQKYFQTNYAPKDAASSFCHFQAKLRSFSELFPLKNCSTLFNFAAKTIFHKDEIELS
jgi:hypothetical protein